MDKLEEPTMGGTIKEMIDKINEIVEWCNEHERTEKIKQEIRRAFEE
jgi:translation initiation factor IF-1